ncbi:hypothetical protein [Actinomadura gamaensis]|uniref:DUF4352 domain-containing protein n=1 Tax=Actinomadura gamaensis TaxID=1763541 RepID=A0ABV9UAG5_9ACTN
MSGQLTATTHMEPGNPAGNIVIVITNGTDEDLADRSAIEFNVLAGIEVSPGYGVVNTEQDGGHVVGELSEVLGSGETKTFNVAFLIPGTDAETLDSKNLPTNITINGRPAG